MGEPSDDDRRLFEEVDELQEHVEILPMEGGGEEFNEGDDGGRMDDEAAAEIEIWLKEAAACFGPESSAASAVGLVARCASKIHLVLFLLI